MEGSRKGRKVANRGGSWEVFCMKKDKLDAFSFFLILDFWDISQTGVYVATLLPFLYYYLL